MDELDVMYHHQTQELLKDLAHSAETVLLEKPCSLRQAALEACAAYRVDLVDEVTDILRQRREAAQRMIEG
jgi:hypothetical protein